MDIIRAIIEERQAQDKRWGGPYHDDMHTDGQWSGILAEQAQDVHALFADGDPGWNGIDVTDLENRVVQVAAVCYAWLEALDRRYAG